jgi:hypothetical protein
MTDKTKTYGLGKKGFLARDWTISLLIFGAIVAILALVLADLATTYDNTDILDSSFTTSYDTFTSTKSSAQSMYETLTTGGGLTVIGTANLLFQSVFTVFNLVLGSLLLPGTILKNFMVDYGVPDSIGNIFMALYVLIPTVIIVFVILSSQSRRDI